METCCYPDGVIIHAQGYTRPSVDVRLPPPEALDGDIGTTKHWHHPHWGVESLGTGVEQCGGQGQWLLQQRT